MLAIPGQMDTLIAEPADALNPAMTLQLTFNSRWLGVGDPGRPYRMKLKPKDSMKSLKLQIRIVIALGVLSLLAGLAAHLALTDIYHGEADVTLEWRVVRICALVLLAFIGSSLFTLARALTAIK